MCKKRLIDMAEIQSIINTWKLINNGGAHQENLVVEPMGVEEAIQDFLSEF